MSARVSQHLGYQSCTSRPVYLSPTVETSRQTAIGCRLVEFGNSVGRQIKSFGSTSHLIATLVVEADRGGGRVCSDVSQVQLGVEVEAVVDSQWRNHELAAPAHGISTAPERGTLGHDNRQGLIGYNHTRALRSCCKGIEAATFSVGGQLATGRTLNIDTLAVLVVKLSSNAGGGVADILNSHVASEASRPLAR